MSILLPYFQSARSAKRIISQLDDSVRQDLINKIAQNIFSELPEILEANKIDIDNFEGEKSKLDRLCLTAERVESMVDQATSIANLSDPVGHIVLDRVLDNGLHLVKVTVPLGVVGMIYESRPNVTLDAAVLGLRSGNVMLLKGSKDAVCSNKKIVDIIQDTLQLFDFPRESVQLLPSDRESVAELLKAERWVDLLIPRGGKGLIDFVRKNSLVPVIETGAGVCHTYVHESADLDKAVLIIENAKTARPSVCNAMDTLLIDAKSADVFLPAIVKKLESNKVEIHADEGSYLVLKKNNYPFLNHAGSEDFGKEYLGLACSIKIVNGEEEALDHIEKFSSRHSEAIIAEDKKVCQKFLKTVDAASVYSNTSTYFSDGGCFGLGAEIGISTQKLHARGPFALEKLVCEKWIIEGDGQIRC